MTRKLNPASRVLLYEVLGFTVIITLSWLNELLGLAALLIGGDHQRNWREAAFETLVILVVAVPTVLLTRRVVARLHYLEGFLRICSWCRRVESDGSWVIVEDFFTKQLDTKSTHGICPTCAEKVMQQWD